MVDIDTTLMGVMQTGFSPAYSEILNLMDFYKYSHSAVQRELLRRTMQRLFSKVYATERQDVILKISALDK